MLSWVEYEKSFITSRPGWVDNYYYTPLFVYDTDGAFTAVSLVQTEVVFGPFVWRNYG